MKVNFGTSGGGPPKCENMCFDREWLWGERKLMCLIFGHCRKRHIASSVLSKNDDRGVEGYQYIDMSVRLARLERASFSGTTCGGVQ